ncbi:MAG: F0F1 ATP synthase subunit B [Sphingorhabdus sp.]
MAEESNQVAAGQSAAETHASTEAHGGEHAAPPSAWGLDPTGWVALSMIAVFAIMLWKKVPAMVAAGLDKQIDAIKQQLDEATKLRQEAEALKTEYQADARQAERDAESIRQGAEEEAKQIVSNAKADASDLIKRRKVMAQQKIAAAETEAVAEVRAKAAVTAASAAETLIASKADIKADGSLIDETIASLN